MDFKKSELLDILRNKDYAHNLQDIKDDQRIRQNFHYRAYTDEEDLFIITGLTEGKNKKLTFTDPNDQSITLQWKSGTNRARRKVSGESWQIIPSYIGDDVEVVKSGSVKVFRYFDSNDNQLATPVGDTSNITRVQIRMTVRTGSGVFQEWEGSCDIMTSVYIKNIN